MDLGKTDPGSLPLYDIAALTEPQRAVLALWPEFQTVAAMKWTSLDQLVRALFHADGLPDLGDEEADQLVGLLSLAIDRLTPLAPSWSAVPPVLGDQFSRNPARGRA